jgi:hypothetical protein
MHSRFIYIGALLIFALSATKILAVGDPTVTGSISRGASASSFSLTVSITSVTKNTLFGDEKSLQQRVRVWLTDVSTSTDSYLLKTGDPKTAPGIDFSVDAISDPVSEASSASASYTFTYTLNIIETTKGSLTKLMTANGGGTSIKVKVSYLENLTVISTSAITTITSDTAIVKEAPTGLVVTGTHKALNVAWKIPETVTWTDASVKAVTEIATLAISDDTSVLNLPSLLYDKTAIADTAGAEDACQYIPDFVDGTNCISCPNELAYLNVEELNKLNTDGKFVSIGKVKDGETAITGLENDKSYGVVIFYQPGGMLRSTCTHSTPRKNVTWSELNGEKEAALKDPKCFIATAAYGSPLHKNLKPLRWFRDHVLLETKLGTSFVDWYYEHGPRGARVVAGHPALQLTVQMILWLPVLAISAWMALLNSDPVLMKMMITVLIASLIAARYIHQKTRRAR